MRGNLEGQIMPYSKRFIKFMNRKNPVYLPEWFIEAWYKQFQEIEITFE